MSSEQTIPELFDLAREAEVTLAVTYRAPSGDWWITLTSDRPGESQAWTEGNEDIVFDEVLMYLRQILSTGAARL